MSLFDEKNKLIPESLDEKFARIEVLEKIIEKKSRIKIGDSDIIEHNGLCREIPILAFEDIKRLRSYYLSKVGVIRNIDSLYEELREICSPETFAELEPVLDTYRL